MSLTVAVMDKTSVEHDSFRALKEKILLLAVCTDGLCSSSHETVYIPSFSQVIFGAKNSILTDINFHSSAKETFRRKLSN